MYKKVSTDLNFVDREKEIEQFWKDQDIFKKSMEQRKKGPTYTFYDGPARENQKLQGLFAGHYDEFRAIFAS